MRCPKCKSEQSHIINSRLTSNGDNRRRRVCHSCGERFTTYEVHEAEYSLIKGKLSGFIKRNDKLIEKMAEFLILLKNMGEVQADNDIS